MAEGDEEAELHGADAGLWEEGARAQGAAATALCVRALTLRLARGKVCMRFMFCMLFEDSGSDSGYRRRRRFYFLYGNTDVDTDTDAGCQGDGWIGTERSHGL